MDLVIAVSQGLGLAAAAGLLAAAPLAIAATAASQGWLEDPLHVTGEGVTVAVTWALVAVELVVDAVWPGAQAGVRLAGGSWPGASRSSSRPATRCRTRDSSSARSSRPGSAWRCDGCARAPSRRAATCGARRSIEDGAGLAAAVAAVVPFVGYLLALAAGWLFARLRRRDDQKYSGLRVLR